ncbi:MULTISPECIES: Flp pilus assembly complex ATPase component TadA [unclassified Fusibacter]|uniref:Flp pilus assembly complex ATPase component TadA n=1 Tax=unclassified Fusibacter TaxID=2624464 RepID=UPI00101202AB|nr:MULTISPECIES: Flp pilus assembly complex ATPase component TadA [unclassified Fusibacter]MCK8060832.1 Flp pilus assembly complex ATPase component TadA [Fusibacter sp. A2]NPE23128.1 Flp pilus assembly complex ATPase component TadA [Fusibacter sp. A1]RXV59800.1 pilus assembly protein CpaF [Fusibacter sp. A1]
MISVLILTLALSVFTYFVFFSSSRASSETWLVEAEKYTVSGVLEMVKQSINNMTKTNLDVAGLSTEAYKRELSKRSELMSALKRCVHGSIKDKRFVKDVIFDILDNSYITESTIDDVIPFTSAQRLSVIDQFDILLHKYKSNYGKEAFSKLVETYQLDKIKTTAYEKGAQAYVISQADIKAIYNKEQIYLSYIDKLQILTQRIYQAYKGFSVIDELRDMNIDGVSGGVSGLVEDDGSDIGIMNQLGKLPQSYESVWVFYKGKSIHLSFLSFGSYNELKRVCQNIYRYNNPGMLSQNVGFKVNDMIDGSRVVVVRPDFSESWAFFVRKFHLNHVTLDMLIKDENCQLPIGLIRYLAKGGRISSITGSQGSGKTTLLMAMVSEIYGTLTLRIQEMAFELHLRKLYPYRNILSFKETSHISGQKGLDVQKKTDGSVNILGEVATDEVAAWMIQMAQVASLFTLFTHHAKTARDLVLSIRNSLLKCDVFRDEKIAEEQVVNVLNFDIHLTRDYSGKRFIERITEIVPVNDELEYPEEYRDATSEMAMQQFMSTMTVFFKKMTDKKVYEARDVVRFEDGRYISSQPISRIQQEAMKELMTLEDASAFEEFVHKNWEGQDHEYTSTDVDVIS